MCFEERHRSDSVPPDAEPHSFALADSAYRGLSEDREAGVRGLVLGGGREEVEVGGGENGGAIRADVRHWATQAEESIREPIWLRSRACQRLRDSFRPTDERYGWLPE